MKRTVLLGAGLALAAAMPCWSPPARAQSSGVNPDISAIGMFIACPQGEEDCAYGEADGWINLQEVELALQGYLNPYVRGDLFAAYHDGEFEFEEAYASFLRGLGPFQARVGKYRVDWGSINPLHPHAYSWIFQPLVEERFFGEEGLNQIAANLNVSFPVGERGELKLSANALRGDIGPGLHDHGQEEGEDAGKRTYCVGPGCEDGICEPGDADCAIVYYEAPGVELGSGDPEIAWHVRGSYFNQFKPSHSILVGVDALGGTIEPEIDRKVLWYGADFKYRWRPDKYRSLNVIGSYMRNEIDAEEDRVTTATCVGPGCVAGVCPEGAVCRDFETVEPVLEGTLATDGWYVLADWQFAERWNGGLKYDQSQGLDSTDAIRRAEAFLNFRIMEESTVFRLLVRREDGDLYESAETTSALQFVFSLGPHRPHSF